MLFTLFPAGQKTAQATIFAALFALAPAAHAQTTASPRQKPAPAPAAAAPAPDATSTDDPAKVAAAREFLKAYRPRLNPAFVAAQMDKFRPQVEANLKKENPKADVKAMMDKRRAEVLTRIDAQLDSQAHLISRYFTVPELKQLTTLFSTGVGKKLIDITPKIQMEMMRQRAVAKPLPGSGNAGAMTGKMVVGPGKSDSKPASTPPGK